MVDFGKDGIFIAAAYAGVGIGVLALIVYAVFDARRVKAKLDDLDARGIRRRSGDRLT